MKKLLAVLFAAVLILGAGAGSAKASQINITIDSTGALLNSVGLANKAEYMAIVGGPGNDPSDNLSFLGTMISRWNGVPLAPVMPAAGALALNQSWDPGLSSYSGPAGYQYVVFHWGAGPAGGNGWWAAYYLGGSAISFANVPTIGTAPVGGFSSARYFGAVSVPDGGATLMLLGGALVGLGALRRKFSA